MGLSLHGSYSKFLVNGKRSPNHASVPLHSLGVQYVPPRCAVPANMQTIPQSLSFLGKARSRVVVELTVL